MKRSANAIWKGGLQEGHGTFAVASPSSKVLKLDVTLDLKIVS